MKVSKILIIFLVLFILSLFCIFLLKIDKVDWKTNYSIWIDWMYSYKKWVDIWWWVSLVYLIDFIDYERNYTNQTELNEVKKNIKNNIEKKIDERVNSLWVSDYTQNFKRIDWKDFIEIQIWWINDIEQAKQTIWKTVKLDFMIPYKEDWNTNILSQREDLAKKKLELINNSSKKDLINFVDFDENVFYFKQSYEINKIPQFINEKFEDIKKIWTWNIFWELIKWEINSNTWFIILNYLWESQKEINFSWTNLSWNNLSWWANNENLSWNDLNQNTQIKKFHDFEILFISEVPKWILAKDQKTWKLMNWWFFLQALSESSQIWKPWVRIDFTQDWKEVWCNLTQDHIWEQVAIFVWWKKVSDPVIQESICWWSTLITFWSTSNEQAIQEWKQLIEELNYTLPVPLVLYQEEKISPILWENALKWAIIAWICSIIWIFIFLIIIYWFKLWITWFISLIVFITIIFWITKILWVVLSLSWISAIILSIWMAVDSNILMFERIKEELLKWKKMWIAIVDWYNYSRSAIRDWNLTTLLIWVLLFMIWTNIFKWFWTSLIINIILTLFIIAPLTKEILLLISRKNPNFK